MKRHGSERASIPPSEYMSFLVNKWCQTIFVEFRLKKLVALSIVGQLSSILSAVNTFYNTNIPQRSLGQLAILTQIEIAMKNDLSYLYLGYWIKKLC